MSLDKGERVGLVDFGSPFNVGARVKLVNGLLEGSFETQVGCLDLSETNGLRVGARDVVSVTCVGCFES